MDKIIVNCTRKKSSADWIDLHVLCTTSKKVPISHMSSHRNWSLRGDLSGFSLWVSGKARWIEPAASSGCCQNCWFAQASYWETCALLTFSCSLCWWKQRSAAWSCVLFCEYLPELMRVGGQERTWQSMSHVWTWIPLFSFPLCLQACPSLPHAHWNWFG